MISRFPSRPVASNDREALRHRNTFAICSTMMAVRHASWRDRAGRGERFSP
jgi:hypothetical protein